ncbi:hypothetical protein MBLNU230_g3018t1 [Neophaeotheca triangularis]
MSQPLEVVDSPSDIISSARFSPSGNKLAVSSWDRGIHLYTKSDNSEIPFTFNKKVATRNPVLDACWGEDENTIYCVGVDNDVCQISLDSEEQSVLSTHGSTSAKVAYDGQHGLVLSISWEGIMHVHKPTDNKHIRIRLTQKPYALSLTSTRVIVAMADRKLSVYELNALRMLVEQSGGTTGSGEDMSLSEPGLQEMNIEPWQQRDSNLKFMTRAVACMPNGEGFTTSSIEGRVSVEWFDPATEESRTYAFKCHRQTRPDPENGGEEVDMVYPINALAYHPIHGTFATGGGDGVVCIWDANTRRRVRMYKVSEASISALDFSLDGKFMAIASGPGFEQGIESDNGDRSMVKLFVRELGETEAKGKPAKK